MSSSRPTGRRPGNPETRDVVLSAARAVFAERGYRGSTIRAIATDAGVDPALVHHYFGTKDQLFLAAVDAPFDPDEVLPAVLAGPREDLGCGIVGMLLDLWDGPAGASALALFRSALGSEQTADLVREFLLARVVRRVVDTLELPPAEATERGTLAVTQLIGLVVARYVLRIEPIASADHAPLVATVGPGVQRYLTGPLPLPLAR